MNARMQHRSKLLNALKKSHEVLFFHDTHAKYNIIYVYTHRNFVFACPNDIEIGLVMQCTLDIGIRNYCLRVRNLMGTYVRELVEFFLSFHYEKKIWNCIIQFRKRCIEAVVQWKCRTMVAKLFMFP